MSAPSSYLPELELSQLRTHPSNPRKKAKADDDMVTSVRESGLLQPLLVAPTGEEDVPYVLIDGHRRLDALKKAKRKTAPANVRSDLSTLGEQVEAMILASLHRASLTPIEEAEAFEQLRGMRGFTQARIAKKTGVPVATVRDRLKLLKLSKATQTRIDKGQLSLTDALALVSFDDDPETQAKLVKAAGTWSWDTELATAKRRRKAVEYADHMEAQLQGVGVAKIELEDPAAHWYRIRDQAEGPVEVEATHSTEAGDHDGCYAYVRTVGYHGEPEIRMVCTNPSSHEVVETAAARERREEQEARSAALAAERERYAVARDVRAAAVQRMVADVALAPPVVDALRALLPHFIVALGHGALRTFQELADAGTWDRSGLLHRDNERDQFDQFVAGFTTASPAQVLATLTAALTAGAEDCLDGVYVYPALVERYYELLAQLDHHRGDVDDEILAKHRGETTEASA